MVSRTDQQYLLKLSEFFLLQEEGNFLFYFPMQDQLLNACMAGVGFPLLSNAPSVYPFQLLYDSGSQ